MEQSASQYAQAKLAQLKADYQVEVVADWGDRDGKWNSGTWSKAELDRLHNAINLIVDVMGGNDRFIQHLGGVKVIKSGIGSRAGEALANQVTFTKKGSFSSWTAVHEFAHAWDGNYGWKLSGLLEKYTSGFTSLILSLIKRLLRRSDSGFLKPEQKPGRYGRWPGCNRVGYFYGDKPSGSDWNFTHKEDFAESVAMYIGWERGNELSQHARDRIIHYQLKNGDIDPFNEIDNWMDYAKYFYPENGDYTKTKRWQFVDDLLQGRMDLPPVNRERDVTV